ncbi:MAG: mechanosensitive ion channel family protein [Cyanophyceae cyanobacterium]
MGIQHFVGHRASARFKSFIRYVKQLPLRLAVVALLIGLMTSAMAVFAPLAIAAPSIAAPSVSTVPQEPPVDDFFNVILPIDNDLGQIRSQSVIFDGNPLFQVAAPSDDLETRVENIESNLIQAKRDYLASQTDLIPTNPPITVQEQEGLPTLYYEDQYLFTVTNLDAKLYQSALENRATVMRVQLNIAFIRAWRERQPAFIRGRIYKVIALWIGGGLVVAVLYLLNCRRQRRYRSQYSPDFPQNLIQTRLRHRRRKHWHIAVSALFRLGQISIPIAAVMATLNLFPKTRPWYRWGANNLRVYLFIAIAIASTYVTTAIIFALVDRILSTWLVDPRPVPQRNGRLQQRIITLSRVIKSIIAVTLALIAVVVILVGILKVDVGPIIAGAGLVGVALSLAAQNLIRDAIEGVLILIEDRYAVGDVVVLKENEIYGLVENITLRITQLRDPEQRLITVPNGEMRIVANLSSRRSQADLKIPIAYSSDLDRALEVITQESWTLVKDPNWGLFITGDPLILGADEFTPWGIIVRVWIETVPLKQWDIAREYRRRIKRALDNAGVEMARSRTETRAEITWEPPASEQPLEETRNGKTQGSISL